MAFYGERCVVCDFICPTQKTRKTFDADIVIWMNTINNRRFEDTNTLFESPKKVGFLITEWNEQNHENIAKKILKNV